MREIKFRQWDSEIGVMYYSDDIESGHLFVFDEGEIICYREEDIQDSPAEPPYHGAVEVDGELMQYTGLKDKNGREIYEGDILEYEYNLDTRHTRKFRDVMEWEICGNWSGFNFNKEMTYEVIGNIYENPELLND